MAFVMVGGDGSQLALFQADGDEPLRQPHHVALRVSRSRRGGGSASRSWSSHEAVRAQCGLRGSRRDRVPLHVYTRVGVIAKARRERAAVSATRLGTCGLMGTTIGLFAKGVIRCSASFRWHGRPVGIHSSSRSDSRG
jgi:hypothetical protein